MTKSTGVLRCTASTCRSALLAALLTLVAASDARAEWKPSGALTASLLVQSGGSGGQGPALGGSLASDLWQSFGALRLGLYVGLHAVGGSDAQSIVFTPVAFSSAVVLDARKIGFEIRIRAGGFGGAVHDTGFIGGMYLGAGVFLDVALSERAAIGFGGELHLLVAGPRAATFDSRAYFAPGITLVYRPERVADAP